MSQRNRVVGIPNSRLQESITRLAIQRGKIIDRLNKRLIENKKELLILQQNERLVAARQQQQIENIEKANGANPEKGRSQESFFVSFSFDRIGQREIQQVVFGGRPPTNYNLSGGKGQGPHIVAYGFLKAAIRKQTIGATLIPKGEGQEEIDAIGGLRNLLELIPDGVTTERADLSPKEQINKRSIAAKLLELERNRNIAAEQFAEEILITDNPNAEIKRRIRKKAAILRQDLNIVTENIMRLWNKRPNVVYPLKTTATQLGPLKPVELYGSGINGRENTAIDNLEDVENAVLRVEGTLEDKAIQGLIQLRDGGKDIDRTNQTFVNNIARLVDIKSPQEFTPDVLKIQFGAEKVKGYLNPDDGALKDIYKKEYQVYLEQAAKEAAELGILATSTPQELRGINVSSTVKELQRAVINQGLLNAAEEDLRKRLNGDSKEETKAKYRSRLVIIEKSKAP